MSDYPDEWAEAVWNCSPSFPFSDETDTAQAVLAAVVPLVRAATLRGAANRLDEPGALARVGALNWHTASAELRRWADEVTG